MSLIGENMRRIREINNLTQKQVSEKMFIDRSIYSKYESGKLIPSEERIKIFANIFNCNLEELKKNNSAIIPDTSALMQNQNLLSLLIEDYKLIIIPTTVIFELDHLKNTSKKKKIASQVMHSILAYKEQTEKIIFEESSFPAINNDSKIIKCAEMSKKKYHMDVFIIHNDIGFCLNYPNNIILKDYIAQRAQGIYANIIKLDELQENFESANDILPNIDINAFLPSGETLIISTLNKKMPKEKKQEKLKFLIKAGADINKTDNSKYNLTPLSHCVQNNDVLSLNLLLSYGADAGKGSIDESTPQYLKIQSKNEGNTPLMIACWHGNLKIVKILCSSKISVNQSDSNGFTALHKCAVQYQRTNKPIYKQIYKYLLENTNIDKLIRDRNNKTAADWLQERKK